MNREYNFNGEIADSLSVELLDLISNCLDPNPMSRYNINQVYESAWLESELIKRKK